MRHVGASRRLRNVSCYYRIPCSHCEIRDGFLGITKLSPPSYYYRFPSSHSELDHSTQDHADYSSLFNLATQLHIEVVDLD